MNSIDCAKIYKEAKKLKESKLKESDLNQNGFLTKQEAFRFLFNLTKDKFPGYSVYQLEIDPGMYDTNLDNLLIIYPYDEEPLISLCEGDINKFTVEEFINTIFENIDNNEKFAKFKCLYK